MASVPYEIITGPASVYIAPVATAFTALNATPSGAWIALGYTEGGVKVRHSQTVEQLKVDQYTGPVKAIRSEEGLEIEFSLAQLTIENFARALNNISVTTSGSPTAKWIPTHKGFDVARWALQVRGFSPYGAGWNLQYEVPVVFQNDEPEVEFVNNNNALLHCTWVALEDLTAGADTDRFGFLRAQSA